MSEKAMKRCEREGNLTQTKAMAFYDGITLPVTPMLIYEYRLHLLFTFIHVQYLTTVNIY